MARTSDVSTKVDNGVLTITVDGFEPIVIDPTALPRELVEQAALHGFKQKYVDAAALGASSTLTEKFNAISALVLHHQRTGEWNRVGGSGDGTSGDGLLVRAIMEACDLTRDQARESVAAMDKKTQHAMRNSPELKPIIDRLRTERAPKVDTSVDTANLLSRLRMGL